MPKIYDNITLHLNKGLIDTIEGAHRADFCVGYFNLRGWGLLCDHIDKFDGGEDRCRLLVGMQRPEEDLLKQYLSIKEEDLLDNPKALELKKLMAESFKKQLTFGIPTNKDESTLRTLKRQLEEEKLTVKLFLRNPLHAKLYLLFRRDKLTPIIGYVGSSNLTMSGLGKQGELNVDVVEQDAADKLAIWFEDRWNDRWCIDITKELITILEDSWASDKLVKPYFIYLKVAYHLSQEARSGINNYTVPKILADKLFQYQANAVSIAARHLDKRGGVIVGDVVGLGKTLTATAIAKLFEDIFFTETLIICPKNLVEMWKDHIHEYHLRGDAISISKVDRVFLEKTRRYRVVIIDESHNLRNRESKRYGLVKEYIERNESKVILLTATPYNKNYHDIANQLRLFITEDQDIGISPERFVNALGGAHEFIAKYQYSPNTLLAFEKSEYSEDWQELLRLYMVRRTRSHIKEYYATFDESENQHFLTFASGERAYFPERVPRRVEYPFDEHDPSNLYAQLYSPDVVNIINGLHLSRYGLGNYIRPEREISPTAEEQRIIQNLSRAGKRLMGFCRTNIFKRLESSGFSFLISLARHVLRNYTFIYAIDKNLPFPIGAQESAEMDEFMEEREGADSILSVITDSNEYFKIAEQQYKHHEENAKKYQWISSSLFMPSLKRQLVEDAKDILGIIQIAAAWNADNDKQLNALEELITQTHGEEKVLIFTQFADTANYLYEQLAARKVDNLAVVTGNVESPTDVAHRFSPVSNKKVVKDEIRVLVCTDVLSEGQNLQDAHIVVNYDLPWALIRLIQRAGRVDRIGQKSKTIFCYSFLPQDGLDRIIRLRTRLRQRITENAEVVGSDEIFFDGDPVNLQDLYNERSGILDSDEGDVDLTSQAYEIWNQATKARPELKKIIPAVPDVVYATKPLTSEVIEGEGVITYHKNSHDFEVLTWLDKKGNVISQAQSRILKALACDYDTNALPKLEEHHSIVETAVEIAEKEAAKTGGQLGSKTGARYRAYMIMKRHYESVKNTLFDTESLKRTIDDVYHFPLRETARSIINGRLKLDATDETISVLCIQLREEGKLCVIDPNKDIAIRAPKVICSMGIKKEA